MSDREILKFGLTYHGGLADSHLLDFYDASQAFSGLHRSLALTTHLIINEEIITQAPSLRGARIYVRPPVQGSFSILAMVGIGAAAAYKAGTAPPDTPLGHLINSGYDYVVKTALGFHVNYDESLGQSLAKHNKRLALPPSKFDSLAEKIETPLKQIHRPITGGSKATHGVLGPADNSSVPRIVDLNLETFEYVSSTERSDFPVTLEGVVSSYNVNTFQGRIYVPAQGRPIPFKLSDLAQDNLQKSLIAQSLAKNVVNGDDALIRITAFKNESKDGRLKGLDVVGVSLATPE